MYLYRGAPCVPDLSARASAMPFVRVAICFCLHLCSVLGGSIREKRQLDDAEEQGRELCRQRDPQEWFRLVSGESNCRDVIQCTASGFQGLRCPPGLAFDIEKQTCDWKYNVKNCELLQKEKKAKPRLVTEEPLCSEGFLACGDSQCIERSKFCDGTRDCADGSDENACDIDSDPNRAPECDPVICQLPDCFCSPDGTGIPGNLNPSVVPQMVMITFDDAINNNNIDLYNDLLIGTRVNPNGCDIKATFFVSHKYTNYSAVQEFHRHGHEIASHSITHRNDENFWSNASIDDWTREMEGQRLIIEKFANITDETVVGLRGPLLRVGGNNQFTMMEEQKFLYDSTITVPLHNPPLWPYTMYFRLPHQCHGNLQNCPTRRHAVWEVVMNELDRREDPSFDENLAGCVMVDSCSNILTGEQFYNFLNHNFDRHYLSNRAPLGLFFHSAWLKNNPDFFEAFLVWIDEKLETHNDVYFVTMAQVIQWMQEPHPLSDIKNFGPWRVKCNVEKQSTCTTLNACPVTTRELPGETLRLHTCVKCPNHYPWLNDPTGEGRF